MYIYIYIYISIYLSVYLSIYPYLSIYLSSHLAIYLYLYLYRCPLQVPIAETGEVLEWVRAVVRASVKLGAPSRALRYQAALCKRTPLLMAALTDSTRIEFLAEAIAEEEKRNETVCVYNLYMYVCICIHIYIYVYIYIYIYNTCIG